MRFFKTIFKFNFSLSPQESGGRVTKSYNLLSISGDAVYLEFDQPASSSSSSSNVVITSTSSNANANANTPPPPSSSSSSSPHFFPKAFPTPPTINYPSNNISQQPGEERT